MALGGIDPIIMFRFFSGNPELLSDIFLDSIPFPVGVVDNVGFVTIPIYLSDTVVGIHVGDETRNLNVDSTVNVAKNNKDLYITQRGINNSVNLYFQCKQSNLVFTLLGAMADEAFNRLTGVSYTISYFHRSIFVLNAFLGKFSMIPQVNTDLYNINIELIKSGNKTKKEIDAEEVEKAKPKIGSEVEGLPPGDTKPVNSVQEEFGGPSRFAPDPEDRFQKLPPDPGS